MPHQSCRLGGAEHGEDKRTGYDEYGLDGGRVMTVRCLLLCVICALVTGVSRGFAGDEEDAGKLFDKAEELKYQQKDNGRALAAYREVVAKYPKTRWAVYAQDMVAFIHYHCLEEDKRAIAAYEELVDSYPKSRAAVHAIFYMAYIYDYHLGNKKTAFAHYLRFYRALHGQTDVDDPASLRLAMNRVNALGPSCAQKLPAELPPKAKIEITGYARTAHFTVWFAAKEKTGISLDYDIKGNSRSFRFRAKAGDQDATGYLSFSVEGITPPLRVEQDGKDFDNVAKSGSTMVLRGIKPNATYSITGMRPGLDGEQQDEKDEIEKMLLD